MIEIDRAIIINLDFLSDYKISSLMICLERLIDCKYSTQNGQAAATILLVVVLEIHFQTV